MRPEREEMHTQGDDISQGMNARSASVAAIGVQTDWP